MVNKDIASADSRSLTVLHIAPTPFFSDRGCHMRIRGIIGGLEKKSVTSILCTYHHGRDVEGIETIRTPAIPGYRKEEAGPSPFKYFADILLLFKVLNIMSTRRPDAIHGHLHEGALIGWMAKMIFFWRKVPLVFDVQGSLVGELDAHGYFRKFRMLRHVFWGIEYLITRMPDYFVCSSQSSLDILRDSFHVKPECLSLVNDGADLPLVNGNEIRHLNSTAGLPQGKPIVIYTGALLESKGLSNLFNLVLEAKKRGIHCHFLIVGYPDEAMKDFCKKNGLMDYCSIVGRAPYEELGNYLALASMAVEPKSTDTGEASGKLLNYMGAGLPVLCFDTPNNRYMLGDSGYYAVPGSVEQLADHIEALANGPREGLERGGLGRQRVMDRFSWDAGAEKVYAVYKNCIAG